ncbi:MAG: DUF1156 domain-containing protein, partial [Candidatus Hodarchaeota archaeon]
SKTLIEDSLPLKAIGLYSKRDKRPQKGHISSMHLWWARKPLPAARMAVLTSLLPAPKDDFNRQQMLQKLEYLCSPAGAKDSSALEEVRKIILAAHNNHTPRILDPFAGGGSIPLEALRCGCEVHTTDLNAVSVILCLCALKYPQILKQKVKGKQSIADEITKWGTIVEQRVQTRIGQFYPIGINKTQPIAYLWARTIICPNSFCEKEIPLIQSFWLSKKRQQKVAMLLSRDLDVKIVYNSDITFDPSRGTIKRGTATCPCCKQSIPSQKIREIGQLEGFGLFPLVVLEKNSKGKKIFREFCLNDKEAYASAVKFLKTLEIKQSSRDLSFIPSEMAPPVGHRSCSNAIYGLRTWGMLYNRRQALSLAIFASEVKNVYQDILNEVKDEKLAKILTTYLSLAVDRLADRLTTLTRLESNSVSFPSLFAGASLPMIWNYAEVNPFNGEMGSFNRAVSWVAQAIQKQAKILTQKPAIVACADAKALPYPDNYFDAIITDPPYYDSVNYSDLSDFYYVWLKRMIGEFYPNLFRTPLTNKKAEIVMSRLRAGGNTKLARKNYESALTDAFKEIKRVLKPEGTVVLMYTHKSTLAWENLLNSLLRAGLYVTASWPIHTEINNRHRALGVASVGATIFLVCRKRHKTQEMGYLTELKAEMVHTLPQKIDHLWKVGVRGVDFFISAIGYAMEYFGKFSRIVQLSGEPIDIRTWLTIVSEMITDFVLGQILFHQSQAEIDPISRFYILCRWLYGTNQIPFVEVDLLAKAMGIESSSLTQYYPIIHKRGAYITLPELERESTDLLSERTLIENVQKAALLWSAGNYAQLQDYLLTSPLREDYSWRFIQGLEEICLPGNKEKKRFQGLLSFRR